MYVCLRLMSYELVIGGDWIFTKKLPEKLFWHKYQLSFFSLSLYYFPSLLWPYTALVPFLSVIQSLSSFLSLSNSLFLCHDLSTLHYEFILLCNAIGTRCLLEAPLQWQDRRVSESSLSFTLSVNRWSHSMCVFSIISALLWS